MAEREPGALEDRLIKVPRLLAMGMERYKGFLIDGSAMPAFATGFDWYSQGTIYRGSRGLSSIVQIKRIRGPIFNRKEAAEQHGLKLCKDWIDKEP